MPWNFYPICLISPSAWLRDDMVIHKKRASSYGERDPWPTLPKRPASQPKSIGVWSKVGADVHNLSLVYTKLRQVNLPYPTSDWGAAESGRDR
jgi:hypothetical protein